MRIAFLVHRIPFPPNKGDKIRSYYELLALREFADVTVACFVDDPDDWKHVGPLGDLCEELIAVPLRSIAGKARGLCTLPTGGSMSLAYYRSAEMKRRIRETAAKRSFDAVLVFSSTMAPYADLVPAPRKVLDLCDLDSEKWAQFSAQGSGPMAWIRGIEARRLGRYEAEAAARFDAALLVSLAEAQILRERSPRADVRVVPNGIDLDRSDPRGVLAAPEPHMAVFCGAMSYHSNEDAVVHYCEAIHPRVRAEIPDAVFSIVGSNPTRRVRMLAKLEGVRVTGRVSDVRPHLLRAAVSVAPLRLGRGVPNKVLEALALELPVVTTPNGAAGLELHRFPGADIAADDDAFAEAVIRRLRDSDGTAVRRFPEHRDTLRDLYSWDRLAEGLREPLCGAAT